jgi:hypothetical protein|tara:strand:- start:1033 stop:1308 length:276 start_codon:yes stop_codon:yes gene_type:complete
MTLSKNVITDKIEMVDTGLGWHIVQVREAHVITEDGVEVSRTNRRYSINPTDSWTSYPADVQSICAVAHTDARKAAYTAYLNDDGEGDATE